MKIRMSRLTPGMRVNCFPSFPTSVQCGGKGGGVGWCLEHWGGGGGGNQGDGPFISPKAER